MSETKINKTNNSITPEPNITKTNKKKPLKLKEMNSKFKSKYFEFYDDVKTHNNGPYDW